MLVVSVLGYYLYIESSSPRVPNDTARLYSPIYGPELVADGCVSFWYHMYGSTTGKYRHFVRPLLCCNIYLSRAPCRCLNCYYYPISCLQFRCFFFTNRIESRCVSLSLSVFDLSSGMTNGVLLLVPRESNDENACGIVRALYCSVLLRFFCFVLFCFI